MLGFRVFPLTALTVWLRAWSLGFRVLVWRTDSRIEGMAFSAPLLRVQGGNVGTVGHSVGEHPP